MPGRPTLRDGRSGRSPFVGRSAALDVLQAGLDRARRGTLAGIVVDGPAGIGKSRLVEEFVNRVAGDAGSVARATCLAQDGQLTPFEPVRELLGDDRDRLASMPEGNLERQFRTATGLLVDRARVAWPLIAWIDDVQWADAATRGFLRFFARAAANEPVLVVLANRGDGTTTDGPVRGLVTSLDRAPSWGRLTLGPLPREHLARLAAARLGPSVSSATLDRLVARSGGVTLFFEELANAVRDGAADEVPGRLRDGFVQRIEQFDRGTRDLLELAAVCGPTFSHELLVAVAEVPVPTVDKRLDDLLDAGVLVADPAVEGWRFRHGLLRETVLSELRPGTRRRLHATCARVIAARPGLAVGSPVMLVGHHWRRAGHAVPALHATVAAAEEATAQQSHAEALRLRLLALDLLDAVAEQDRDEVDAVGLRLEAAGSAARTGEHATAAELLEEAVAASGHDVAVRRRVAGDLVMVRYLAGDLPGASAAASTALRELDLDDHPRVRAPLESMAAVVGTSGEDPVRATTRAVTVARELDDHDLLGAMLSAHGLTLSRAGNLDGARAALDEAERLTAGAADPRDVLRPAVYRLLALLSAGVVDEVVHLGPELVARADHLGVSRSVGQQARAILADAQLFLGWWDAAADTIEDGLAWGDASLTGTLLLLVHAELAMWRGRPVEAERDLATARERMPHGHFRVSLAAAEISWWRGDVVASRTHAIRGLSLAGRVADPDEYGRLAHAVVRATAAGAGRDLDDGPAAEALQELARRSEHPVIGAWHRTAQVWAEGPTGAGWDEVCRVWRRLGRRAVVGVAAWQAALAHADEGDREAAARALDEAELVAADLGAVPLEVEVRAARQAMSLWQASSSAVATASSSPGESGTAMPPARSEFPDDQAARVADRFDLTPRQAEVLALVARGWTNRRIARDLAISPRTVGVHVSGILERLGVSTRGEAAAIVHGVDVDDTA